MDICMLTLSIYSMYPLLKREELVLPYFATAFMWNWMIGYPKNLKTMPTFEWFMHLVSFFWFAGRCTDCILIIFIPPLGFLDNYCCLAHCRVCCYASSPLAGFVHCHQRSSKLRILCSFAVIFCISSVHAWRKDQKAINYIECLRPFFLCWDFPEKKKNCFTLSSSPKWVNTKVSSCSSDRRYGVWVHGWSRFSG